MNTCKLTEEQVHLIRATKGLISGSKMARLLGMGISQVCEIRRSQAWKWLPEKNHAEILLGLQDVLKRKEGK